MNEIGIPKIIYSQLTTKFAIDSIKTFLILNKNKNKLIDEFILYDPKRDEIKIKILDYKNSEFQYKNVNSNFVNLNEEKVLIDKLNQKLNNFFVENKKEIEKLNQNKYNSNITLTQNIYEGKFKTLKSELNLLLNIYTYNSTNLKVDYFSDNNSQEKLEKLLNENNLTSNNSTKLNFSYLSNMTDLNKIISDNVKYTDILILNNKNSIKENFDNDNKFFSIIDAKNIKINLRYIISELSDDDLINLTTFKFNLKVKNVVKSESGKWPSILGNTIALDSKNARDYINFNLAEKIQILIKNFLKIDVNQDIILNNLNKTNNFEINKFTPTVNIILEDKFNIYKKDENEQRRIFAKITDNISRKLGYNYPVTSEIPLYMGFKIFNIVKIFLKNIFNSIIFFIWILSFMLVYSLILSNVDERNYEFGMLRSLGFKKANLILVIIFQSFLFSLPAICIGLIFAYIVNIPISLFFFNFAGIEVNLLLSKTTVILGIIAGLTLPLISSYFPVKKALSSNLKDSLSILNKKISDVSVNIVKLEKLGISPSMFLSSLILIILGFITYYLAPLSFLMLDYSMFLFILNSILIMMIIGMILLIQIIVPYFQNLILNILMFIFKKDRNLKFVIAKNLNGHFRRNQKSSIMFMIALSFVIFAGCTILLICNFVISASKNVFGSDIWVANFNDNDTLDEKELIRYLTDFNQKFPKTIKNFTFISMALHDIIGTKVSLTTLNGNKI